MKNESYDIKHIKRLFHSKWGNGFFKMDIFEVYVNEDKVLILNT